ncbi:MAG: tail fiber domain-containing protein [Bacteroidetes bacterium]|nr:tail fiber domain-containing protein [Bacteroidota bacterium]
MIKQYLILLTLLFATSFHLVAQTNVFPTTGSAGIGTIDPNSSSLLDITSTTKGVLVPRMTKAQRDAIVSPATGLLIYQTNANPGFFYFNGSQWSAISTQDANRNLSNLTSPTTISVNLQPNADNTIDLGSLAFSWKDMYVDGVGNLGTAKVGNYVGTPQAGMIRYNGVLFQGYNGTSWESFSTGGGLTGANQSLDNLTATSINQHMLPGVNASKDLGNITFAWKGIYADSLYSLGDYNLARINSFGSSLYLGPSGPADKNAGTNNTIIGKDAGENIITGADNNTIIGVSAGAFLTSGKSNVLIGNSAGFGITTGTDNVSIGKDAGGLLGIGNKNVFIGTYAGRTIKSGYGNLCIGENTMFSDGGLGNDSMNVILGHHAGSYNAGSSNIMIGDFAGHINESNNNVFIGSRSGQTSNGTNNTFVGSQSGLLASDGVSNTFIGSDAGFFGSGTTSKYNVYVGDDAGLNTNGAFNTFVGSKTGNVHTGNDNCVLIGYNVNPTSGLIDNAIAIGYGLTISQSNSVRLGGTSITKLGIGKNASASNIMEFQVTTARLTTGGVWTNASDERIKDQKQQLDKNEMLEKINKLKIERWHYLADEQNITHIGPYAQDFYKLFEVGDDTTISTIDPAGVALIGIQALSENNSSQQADIEAIINENELLNDRLNKMELLLSQLQNSLTQCCNSSESSSNGNATLSVSDTYFLGQNIPNPFENKTVIPFKIPTNCTDAKIIIAEMETGKIIIEEEIDCNQLNAEINLSTLASGTYSYSLMINNQIMATKQMVRTK